MPTSWWCCTDITWVELQEKKGTRNADGTTSPTGGNGSGNGGTTPTPGGGGNKYMPPLPDSFTLGGTTDDSNNQTITQSCDRTFAYFNGNRVIINGTGTLHVFDILGRKLFSKELSTDNSQLSINTFPSSGIYILRLGEKSQKQQRAYFVFGC